MLKQVGYGSEGAAEAPKALVLTLGERCLRPADILDNLIRRIVIAVLAIESESEAEIRPVSYLPTSPVG
jgi:hypothetical protein